MTIARPYPTSGYLVHAGFGVRPYNQAALPLQERDLPEDFRALDEAVQDRRMDAAITLVLTWAKEQGADRVEADMMSTEVKVAERAGLRRVHGRYRFAGPFALPAVLQLLSANPDELRVFAGERLVVFMYETWDSIVVQAPDDEMRDLAARLATGLS